MSNHHNLRTLAFRLPAGMTELPFTYLSLSIPPHWQRLMDDLSAAGERVTRHRQGLHTKSLQQLPLALFQQLISAKYPGRNGAWLYSAQEVEQEHLQMVFSAWMEAEYRRFQLRPPVDLDAQISGQDLEWRPVTCNLAEKTVNRWGTAEPSASESYTLFPELVADALSRRGIRLDFAGQTLEFRRAPVAGGGAELISWKPLDYRGYAYSVFIRFMPQTVPYQDFVSLHCSMGLHRWVSANNTKLGRGRHTVYLLTGLPGVNSPPHTRRFQIAPVKWERTSGGSGAPGEAREFRLAWHDLLPTLFETVHPNSTLPSPDEMVREPLKFINQRGLNAAIAFHNTSPSFQHKVKTGLTPRDRAQLVEQVAHHLKKNFGFVFVDAPQRVTTKFAVSRPNAFFPPAATRKLPAKGRGTGALQSLAEAAGKKVRLEIWYQSDTIRDALAQAVVDTFGLKSPGRGFRSKGEYSCLKDDVQIDVTARPLGNLADKLEDASWNNRGRALWSRADEVIRVVGKESPFADRRRLSIPAFVEIDKSAEFAEENDPKGALRAGFAGAGRITQFINPGDENLGHRARMSLLDIMRQLGVQSGLPECVPRDDSRTLRYAALWVYKQSEDSRRFLPMMLRMSADGSLLEATAHGLGQFLPYPVFLRRLAERGATKFIADFEKNRVPPLIRQWLSESCDGSDLLLFAHSKNTREVWSWLANRRMPIDHLFFGSDEEPKPISAWPGLRVVRVRDCESNETPESFGHKGPADAVRFGDGVGFTQGLFKVNDRVFHSLAKKPKQRAGLLRTDSKALDPDLQAWNARIVELTVPCIQEGDEPWQWAMLAHKLRGAMVNTDDPTTFPLPLRLLSAAKEYADIGATAAAERAVTLDRAAR